jgi:predicted ATPase
MYLKAVLIRFFKSFNYDFLRKHHPVAAQQPWELIDGAWFPFVRVPLLKDITTVVGANESGKSHLLSAIEKGLCGTDITRRDFCRYSQFFTVEEGRMRWPDFGFQFAELTREDQEELRKVTDIKTPGAIDSFTLIRSERSTLEIWLPNAESFSHHPVSRPQDLMGSVLLPKVFHIDSSVALPSSVPLSWLRGTTKRRWPRKDRNDLIETVDGLSSSLATQEAIKGGAASIFSSFSRFFSGGSTTSNGHANGDRDDRAFALAKDLIFKVANIDKAAIQDLSDALSQEDEGLANGILQQINQRLATALNFPKWWVQDRDFRLTVSARDDDLVFTISDRTHTEYSFGERSNGLKYFLSYYIQYLAHEAPAGRQEILLMDEPDAYLSSQGQQDLLKIFNSFAQPEDERQPVQVVYVTHSPFLIDRNHGERIRVLEKGTDDEGTRVVNDASKNHYEPLRSSFGAFVAETTFIGNCNLMVEGLADQVLLAGISNYLRSLNTPRMNTLDLNRITIVPAGSASHIPYLVYLARGRDIEQPAVIVLLDNDKAGKDAQKGLKKGGPKGKQLIKPEYVLMTSSLQADVNLPDGRQLVEIEDFIPPGIAAIAVQRYLETVCTTSPIDSGKVTAATLITAWGGEKTLYDAIGEVVQRQFGADAHIDKVGLARAVVEVVQLHHSKKEHVVSEADVGAFQQNFKVLLARLAHLQRQAERDSMQERISQRIDRSVKAFLRDHTVSSRREDAMLLLEEIDAVLDESLEADQVRMQLQRLRREHDLTEPKPGMVEDMPRFTDGLRRVRYSAVNAMQQETIDLDTRPNPQSLSMDDAPKDKNEVQAEAGSKPVPAQAT